MKIKKGDKVIVIAGKDKGKSGEVVRAIPSIDKVVVEGINLSKKHQKAKSSNTKGQIVEIAMPIHVSNVALIDPKTKKATRIGIEKKDGKRVRIAKKSGTEIK